MDYFRRDSARAILEKAGLFPSDVGDYTVLMIGTCPYRWGLLSIRVWEPTLDPRILHAAVIRSSIIQGLFDKFPLISAKNLLDRAFRGCAVRH